MSILISATHCGKTEALNVPTLITVDDRSYTNRLAAKLLRSVTLGTMRFTIHLGCRLLFWPNGLAFGIVVSKEYYQQYMLKST